LRAHLATTSQNAGDRGRRGHRRCALGGEAIGDAEPAVELAGVGELLTHPHDRLFDLDRRHRRARCAAPRPVPQPVQTRTLEPLRHM
jgi:hypothetical protein